MKRLLLTLLCALIVSGCSWSRGYVTESLIDPAYPGDIRDRAYCVMPEDESVNRNSLEFKRFLSICERALLNSGFKTVQSLDQADSVIYASFGTDSQTRTVYEDRPIYETVRVAKNTYGHARGPHYRERTEYENIQVIAGYEQVSREVVTHKDSVELHAYTLDRRRKADSEIWSLTCSMAGNGAKIFSQPDSAAQWEAILSYNLGTHTGSAVGRTLRFDDKSQLYYHE